MHNRLTIIGGERHFIVDGHNKRRFRIVAIIIFIVALAVLGISL